MKKYLCVFFIFLIIICNNIFAQSNVSSPFEGVWNSDIDTYIFKGNNIMLIRIVGTSSDIFSMATFFEGTFTYTSNTITINYIGQNILSIFNYAIVNNRLTLIRNDGELIGTFRKLPY
ncbi:MAG: lipocalin family protein [Treponema sp.]|nr:lipocalin family protein [Treponema sp.]